ncbi:MAG: hypothetical protein IT445_19225, partial [Phycisphaeraceae bacterium]|nr:hypothetical protein [Phycisphaeraceae bacterium]MCC6683036.1 hypothetical protein [Phycisphaeraceae bacterium]
MNTDTRLSLAASSTRVISAEVVFTRQAFVQPLILSSGKITNITQAVALVRVEVGGAPAEGRGCIYLS